MQYQQRERSTAGIINYSASIFRADLVSDPYGNADRAAQNTCCCLGKKSIKTKVKKKKQLAISCLPPYSEFNEIWLISIAICSAPHSLQGEQILFEVHVMKLCYPTVCGEERLATEAPLAMPWSLLLFPLFHHCFLQPSAAGPGSLSLCSSFLWASSTQIQRTCQKIRTFL